MGMASITANSSAVLNTSSRFSFTPPSLPMRVMLKSGWPNHVNKIRSRSLGHSKLETTQIYTHVMQKPGLGVRSPLDGWRMKHLLVSCFP